jgi:hypothetical protein
LRRLRLAIDEMLRHGRVDGTGVHRGAVPGPLGQDDVPDDDPDADVAGVDESDEAEEPDDESDPDEPESDELSPPDDDEVADEPDEPDDELERLSVL